MGVVVGLGPFVAAALVGWSLSGLGPAARNHSDAATLLRDASDRVVAAADGSTSYAADVVYERSWDGGSVAATFRVHVVPERDIRVEFQGVRGRHGDREFGTEADMARGMAVRVPGLKRALRLVRDPDLAARNYVVVAVGDETVAGRSARRYRLTPRHEGRRILELVVDAATSIPLERREIGADGADLGAWRVTGLTIPAPDTSDAPAIPLPMSLHPLGDPDLGPAAERMQLFTAGWLPPGFAEIEAGRHDTSAGPIVRTEYTDGVARLSIVQWPTGADVFGARRRDVEAQLPPILRETMRGMMGRWKGRRGKQPDGGRPQRHRWGARATVDGTEIRVVGDVDKTELQRVAEQLRPREVAAP